MEKIVKLSVETFTNDPLETHPFSLLFSLKLYSYGGGGGVCQGFSFLPRLLLSLAVLNPCATPFSSLFLTHYKSSCPERKLDQGEEQKKLSGLFLDQVNCMILLCRLGRRRNEKKHRSEELAWE
ncbi:hypothetical protein QQP08_021187 [Theobroma cacao]|nr:hypothetical protein QQP08_021187 [Theobroma cacao]